MCNGLVKNRHALPTVRRQSEAREDGGANDFSDTDVSASHQCDPLQYQIRQNNERSKINRKRQ